MCLDRTNSRHQNHTSWPLYCRKKGVVGRKVLIVILSLLSQLRIYRGSRDTIKDPTHLILRICQYWRCDVKQHFQIPDSRRRPYKSQLSKAQDTPVPLLIHIVISFVLCFGFAVVQDQLRSNTGGQRTRRPGMTKATKTIHCMHRCFLCAFIGVPCTKSAQSSNVTMPRTSRRSDQYAFGQQGFLQHWQYMHQQLKRNIYTAINNLVSTVLTVF